MGHTKSIAVIDFARNNGIILMSLPPHTTHRLQPLDTSLFKSVESYYDEAISQWLRNHPGRAVTTWQVAGLFAEAYGRAATIQTAVNGFRSTGIMPYDPNVIPDHMYAPSDVTDTPMANVTQNTQEPQPSTSSEPQPSMSSHAQNAQKLQSSTITQPQNIHEPQPSTRSQLQNALELQPSSSSMDISFEDIMPIPKASRATKQSRRPTKAEVLTGSPYKKVLNEAQQASKGKGSSSKRPSRGKQMKQKKSKVSKSQVDVVVDRDDTVCLTCGEFYRDSAPGEKWIQCDECKDWAHEDFQYRE